MALSVEQLSDFRADIADQGDAPAFTDDELNRLYERADSNYEEALYLAMRQLRNNAAKFANYTAGMTSEQRKQVFDNLVYLTEDHEREARGANQARVVGIRRVPPPVKERPAGELHPDSKAIRHDDSRLRRRRYGWPW